MSQIETHQDTHPSEESSNQPTQKEWPLLFPPERVPLSEPIPEQQWPQLFEPQVPGQAPVLNRRIYDGVNDEAWPLEQLREHPERFQLTTEEMEMIGWRLRKPRSDKALARERSSLEKRMSSSYLNIRDNELRTLVFPELTCALNRITSSGRIIGGGIVAVGDGFSYTPELVPIINHVNELKGEQRLREAVVPDKGKGERRRFGQMAIRKIKSRFKSDETKDESIVFDKLLELHKLYKNAERSETQGGKAINLPSVGWSGALVMIDLLKQHVNAGQTNVWEVAAPILRKASPVLYHAMLVKFDRDNEFRKRVDKFSDEFEATIQSLRQLEHQDHVELQSLLDELKQAFEQ